MEKHYKTAVFAGGCFWCMQGPFDILEGVIDTDAGYCGGKEENPSYEAVANGLTGHREVVRVTYDPNLISYKKLLDIFWMNIDPTQENGQFYDIGNHYRTAIYYTDASQKEEATRSKTDLEKSGKFPKKIVTEIIELGPFYRAEEYHQDYYKKNPLHYNLYKKGSGREDFIKKKWED